MYLPILSNSLVVDASFIISTIDEPIMMPSENLANVLASSAVFIPNPASVGRSVYFLILPILFSISDILRFEEPVTPLRLT